MIGIQVAIVLLAIMSIFKLGFLGAFIFRFISIFFGNLTTVTLVLVILINVYIFLSRKTNLPKRYVLGGLFIYSGLLLIFGILEVQPEAFWSGLQKLSFSFVPILKGEMVTTAGLIGMTLLGVVGTLFGYAGCWILAIVSILIGIVCIGFDWFSDKAENREPVEITKPNLSRVRKSIQKNIEKEPTYVDDFDFDYEFDDPNDNGSFFVEPEKSVFIDVDSISLDKPVANSSIFIDVDEPTEKLPKLKKVEFGITVDDKKPARKKRKIERKVEEPVEIKKEVEEPVEEVPSFTLLTEEEKKKPKPKKKKVVVEEEEEEPHHYVHVRDENWANYKLPKLNLLDDITRKGKNSVNALTSREQGQKLIAILKQFGVEAELKDIHIGPSVTKFEIKPQLGVRVSKISGLQDDIKMALAATDIRIEAPIPGKNAVGVEIPNVEKTTVQMKELMKNIPDAYKDRKLVFCIGKDLMGNSCYGELNKMPHLLIAGATGSGKSVCVNAIISSILMRTRPDEVKLILIDPKKVEFTPYNGVPHLLAPVITDGEMANKALKVVVSIMDKRYDMFSEVGVRNISGYNAYVANHPEANLRSMTSMVVIIDELADLMLVAAKEVEASIQRITQLARAAGIHLIVATQRPSVDVITGVIKANIPSRIAFMVSSQTDSRTILDQAGADRLLGNGDMLYLPNGETSPKRIQGVFITDDEVNSITEYVKSQGQPMYDDTFIALRDLSMQGGEVKPENADPLYPEVRNFVIQSRKASTSLIQRRFSVGYSRAARLIDVLESEGVIGPANGSKPREILVGKDNLED
ncbi:MAG: DUF87 domain-containing protein [Firmicutes bacterium]|nr:DUF87 domain-containing protein [Bacillota bacterium]